MQTTSLLTHLVVAGAIAMSAACTDSQRPASTDERRPDLQTPSDAAAKAGDRAAAATETVDVKAALTLDSTVDASDINVDTDAVAKVVTLKGSVPTEAQRTQAESIARREAEGYRIDNQLVVSTAR